MFYTNTFKSTAGVLIFAIFCAVVASALFVTIYASAETDETAADTLAVVSEEPVVILEETVVVTDESVVSDDPVISEEITTVSEEPSQPVETQASEPVEVLAESVADSSATAPAPTLVLAPELSTDKADYLPGETATIFGRFFSSLQNIVLKIFGYGPDGDKYTESTQNITTDTIGAFTTAYTLDNVYRPLYTVIASNLFGEELARTTFTDAPPSANLDQCRNGSSASPVDCTGGAWVNGNAGASNAHYTEGGSIAYIVRF